MNSMEFYQRAKKSTLF